MTLSSVERGATAGVMDIDSLVPLAGATRPYAWGSATAIPELLGIEPDGRPAAEYWLGAHPDSATEVVGHGTDLRSFIAADPQRVLGAETSQRFDGTLPFLLKVLAAEHALSIQVHPTLEYARAAYSAQRGQGGSYTDPNHKPELLCALTHFQAFCGFRPVPRTLDFLRHIARHSGGSAPGIDALSNELLGEQGLRRAFEWIYSLNPTEADALLTELLAGCASVVDGQWQAEAIALSDVARDFPGDVGLAVAALLNFVVLEPGEAVFLGAGNVHAYVRGLGVEIMANSDNVLRCGLTAKHVDVGEVMRIADFAALDEPRFAAEGTASGRRRFRPPVGDFELTRWAFGTEYGGATNATADLAAGYPRILFVADGTFTLAVGDRETSLVVKRGNAVFAAADATVHVTGDGLLFEASPSRP